MVVKELRQEIKKIDPKGIAVLLTISIILGFIYSFFINNLVLAVIATTLAVFGSYFLFTSFFEEEKPVVLLEGEKMILRTLDRAYIMFPGKKGGFMTTETERDLNIYLTNKRIFARKNSGEQVFEQSLQTIMGVVTEKKFLTKYLRVTYNEAGMEKQALIFIGDTDIWNKRLAGLGIKSADEYDTDAAPKETYKEDATKLQGKIDKKQDGY